MSYQLVRDAEVQVTEIEHRNQRTLALTRLAHIEVATPNGTYEHTFDPRSRVTKALEFSGVEALQDRLNHGQFFFVDGQLVDFRDRLYDGFVHTDENIDRMVELIGYQDVTTAPARVINGRAVRTSVKRKNGTIGNISLAGEWDERVINVPAALEGGVFDSHLLYTWNPFYRSVRGVFELVRQICTNGMVGTSSFLNTQIPIINRWEEHLDIAASQIQNKVNAKVTQRIEQMMNERASVGVLQQLSRHTSTRLSQGMFESQEQQDGLIRLNQAVNPVLHLQRVYKSEVFANQNIANRVPGHLSTFDAWNVATELVSHYPAIEGKSTDNALYKIANNLMWADATDFVSTTDTPKLSSFSSPERAFFGEVTL